MTSKQSTLTMPSSDEGSSTDKEAKKILNRKRGNSRGKPLPIFVYTGIHFLSDYIDYRGVQLLHNITQITMNTSDYQMITPDYIALHVITCSLHAITFDYM